MVVMHTRINRRNKESYAVLLLQNPGEIAGRITMLGEKNWSRVTLPGPWEQLPLSAGGYGSACGPNCRGQVQ